MNNILFLLEAVRVTIAANILQIGAAILMAVLLWFALARLRRHKNITIRNASLTVEELEDHARRMAIEHAVSSKINILNWPLSRMNESYGYILSVYKSLNEDIINKRAVPPAAEWLLDNFYQVEEQVKSIRRDLKKKDYYKLPVLKKGPFKGYTRVYAIATELVAHVDGQIEENTLIKYLEAYQSHTILFDRELWVIPTMIRLVLIENIRTISEKIGETRKQWHIADDIVERWWSDEAVDSVKLVQLFKNNIESIHEANPSFVEHLFYRLRRSGRSYSDVLRYIDEHLDKFGVSTEDLAQKEHNAQAVSTVSIGNCIISLKYVSGMNWIHLFEAASYVENILQQDPQGIYKQMDVDSRNHYRNRIELLARTYGVSELHIAREAIGLAQKAAHENHLHTHSVHEADRKNHVGYYLVGKGVKILENKQKGTTKPVTRLVRLLNSHPGRLYMGSIGILTLVLVKCAIDYAMAASSGSYLVAVLLTGAAVLIPASEMAIALVNWLVCKVKRPAVFPRLELREGIPESLSTMVVIPTLLPDEKRVTELLENMENHYLANTELNLYFALIGAFKDSHGPKNSDDSRILLKGFSGVYALNQKYAKDGKDIFYFYHRLSQFNEIDNNWTGWERKRGALMEFNDMLLGSDETSFTFYSNIALPAPNIKYVITLDADTVLPLGMAKKMIGTMAHPLNRPVIDPEKGIVTEGYGLMQPRISFDMDSSNRSVFARIYTGQEGIDPYASAISDVYQDLFDEGIFTGKGIYDLKVFQTILKDAVPDNAILSHDLLEGSYVRAALVTDLELVDSYPSKYNSFIARLHRWIRGDWQLIPWLGRKIYDGNMQLIKNPLSHISIWKMADNLRRSLVAPAIMLLILLGFSVLPGSSFVWTGIGITALGLPLAINFWSHVFTGGLKPDKIKRHIPGFFGLKATAFQFLLAIVFLPYQAVMILDAVTVTLVRVLITKKNMLEWVTSADVEKDQSNTLKSYASAMGTSTLQGAVIVILAFFFKRDALGLSLMLCIIWGASPLVAYFISRDDNHSEEKLEAEDLLELRKIARKTWRYFEEFANHKNNYLAPDNYQEDPPRGVAYRTSPTNIGLGLLASLSGRDLGYSGIVETVDALSKTVATIEKMEKWHGHLYNWYDTRTLEPLKPVYVSTVDSGNYVCYLVTLMQGLKSYYTQPLLDEAFIRGIRDTLQSAVEEDTDITSKLACFSAVAAEGQMDPASWYQALEVFSQEISETVMRKPVWKSKLENMISMFRNEMDTFIPWISQMDQVPEGLQTGELAEKTAGLMALLRTNESLNALPVLCQRIINKTQDLQKDLQAVGVMAGPEQDWLHDLKAAAGRSDVLSQQFNERYNLLIDRIDALSSATRFSSLYDEKRQLFSIGYSIDDNKMTNSYYDLLASEARQTSYIAIARGEVPPKHWFTLGRSLTVVDHFKGLVSWSGTMFEYLMPLLIMKSYRNTLLDETYSFVIKSQKKYGKQRGMPWGASESAYNALDINLDYQYKAIGVPWLGLKRGLIEDAVTAPYASFLALMVNPYEAFKNIKTLKSEGLEGPYGYYEAADYTPERLNFESKKVIIKSFMAHHQGMSLLALNNYLNHNIMQTRFSSDPYVKAARLLLQEKIPLDIVFTKDNKEKIMPSKGSLSKDKGSYRRYTSPDPILPKAHVLSNGSYSVMVTDRGTGYSRSKTVALSRWREDAVLDSHGMFFYVKNVDFNRSWSAAYAPMNMLPEKYEAVFTADKAAFKRTDGDIETETEIVVASGDSVEIRRIKLKNNGDSTTTLEVTSYCELVIASPASDLAHPAFSNLFIGTEFDAVHQALLGNRRTRNESDTGMWVAQIPVIDGETVGDIQYETDRMQFLGRGHTVGNPVILERERPLSNTVGPVLDPIFSLRVRVKVEPGEKARISFVTAMADSREAILELIEKYAGTEACDAAFWLAVTRSQVETKYLNIKAPEMEQYQNMISSLLFLSPMRRKNEQLIRENRKGQTSLWPYGISGDRPIVLLMMNKTEESEILYEVLKAHEYWRLKDLKVDLVILCQEENSYTNPLISLITDIVHAGQTHDVLNRQGDVFILNANTMAFKDVNLLCAAARIVFKGADGTMKEQLQTEMPNALPEPARTGGESIA